MRYAAVILIFIAFAFWWHFGYQNINDPDSFYHIRHAWVYRTAGLFDSSFPWTQFSVIKNLGSDLWYGFHLLLIPFTYFKDLILGLKISGVLLTAAALLIFFIILKKFGARYPMFWTMLLGFSAPDFLFRLAMIRPHLVTLILSLLLFFFLLRCKPWGVLLASFGISFFHLSLSWIAILIFGIVSIVKIISKRYLNLVSNFHLLISCFSGLIVGWLLRPNPIGAIKLAYIQVVQLMIEKFRGVPLRFGAELKPIDWSIFTNQFIPILLLFIPAITVLSWLIFRKKLSSLSADDRIAVWASLALSIIFMLLTALVARRSIDFWLGFTVIFVALIFTALTKIKKEMAATALAGVVILGIFMAFNSVIISGTYRAQAVPPNKFHLAALWLKDHSRPGEIVVNFHWDNFGSLFFWNSSNYYISGMDPIFQYAYDKNLYWKIYFPEIDKIIFTENQIYTCGEIRCTAEQVVDLKTALERDFKARYILVEHRRNPKLKDALDKSRGFEDVYSTETETIYEIL